VGAASAEGEGGGGVRRGSLRRPSSLEGRRRRSEAIGEEGVRLVEDAEVKPLTRIPNFQPLAPEPPNPEP